MNYQAKSQNSARYADMQSHFEKKQFFLGEKSIKCPVIQAQFEEKITF